MAASDFQLLDTFVREKSESAFDEIVRRYVDDQGNPIEFRKTHNNGMHSFAYRLNQPIAPGHAGVGSTQGVVPHLIKNPGGGLKAYSFDHSPGGFMPVRRIELFR